MNLLIGVLGNNFELYQDRSDVLFQRARAKMMLELRDRLTRRLSNWILLILKDLLRVVGDRRDRLMEYKCGRVALWVAVVVVKTIELIVFLPFLAVFLLISVSLERMRPGAIQFAIKYALWDALGYGGDRSDTRMEDCGIFLVRRAEPPLEDLRSLRSEMKSQVKNLESLVSSVDLAMLCQVV